MGMTYVLGELNVKRTRYPDLGYARTGDIWRVVDINSGSVVGPHYKTRIELLADLNRYAHDYGCVAG